MAKKHIPLKDRPTVVFNGTLEEKKSVRVSGKTMIEIKIKQGTTLYRILLDELAEKTLPQVGKFDKFETVEKDFITYKYKEIDIKNLDTELHLSGGTFTNKPPKVFKKVAEKEKRYLLVGRDIKL
jgi:hypothetical protein